jgi:P-type E1-E2 ATPase
VEHAQRLKLDILEPTAFETIPGRGVRATVAGKTVLVGNDLLLKKYGLQSVPDADSKGIAIYVAIDGKVAGAIEVADQIRPGAADAIRQLKLSGVKRIVLLTGDNSHTANRVATELGITEVHAQLLPEQKVEIASELQRNGHSVAMVGDGINDAPVLATATVGIAMGAKGTQAALEAADVALMTDDLSKIVFARTLAKRAYRTIQENLFFGVGVVHVLGISAALLGWIGPIQAAMIHLGPDILVFLNSVKLLRVPISSQHA